MLLIILIPFGFLFAISLFSPVYADVQIETVIDTVGMVDDHTTIAMKKDSPANSSSMVYRDSSMTNGGAFTLHKLVQAEKKKSKPDLITSQKILHYNNTGTGSILSGGEKVITSMTESSSGSDMSLVCTFYSADSGNANRSQSASASTEIMNAQSLQLSSSTRISPDDLQYSVTANNSLISENYSGPSTMVSSFTYDSINGGEKNHVSERSMVSGLYDLFSRVYHTGNGADIQAQTRGSGMVSSKTVAEHSYDQMNRSASSAEWSGYSVYTANTLTNGGDLDETRVLSTDSVLTSERIITYQVNGSHAMQTDEKVVAVKERASGSGTSSVPGCVFAGGNTSSSEGTSYQSVIAASQLFGVESAQSSSVARIEMGAKRNGTMPMVLNYHADITSPIQFDPKIFEVMTDPDNDGIYEDLNGNKKQDMQDLVLLFRNFEWLSKNSNATQFDYNGNRRVDLADLIQSFKEIR